MEEKRRRVLGTEIRRV